MKHTDITASRVLKSVLSSAALIAATISVIQPTVGFSADAKTSAPADANVTAASKDLAVAILMVAMVL